MDEEKILLQEMQISGNKAEDRMGNNAAGIVEGIPGNSPEEFAKGITGNSPEEFADRKSVV